MKFITNPEDIIVASIIEVYLLVPIKTSFSYIHSTAIEPGSRVIIPFGRNNQHRLAIVVSSKEMKSSSTFKRVVKVIDEKPLFNSTTMRLLQFASNYYFSEQGKVFASALPKKIREVGPATPICNVLYKSTITDVNSTQYLSLKRAKKQQKLIDILLQNVELDKPSLIKEGISNAILKSLLDKQFVKEIRKPHAILSKCWGSNDHLFHELTTEQQNAFNNIVIAENKPVLLHGVTGSGKTEIYVNLIRNHVNARKQVLLLVPEIGLTPQLTKYMQSRFTCPVVTLNSGMSDGNRELNWRMAHNGQAGIVIGTRSAVYASFKDLGLIIVDEEHDQSYKQDKRFSYNGKDMALMRANFEGIPCILGSATPSLESWKMAQEGRYELISILTRAVKNSVVPEIKLLDTKDRPIHRHISSASLNKIESHVKNGGQVLVYLGRRGYAPVVNCNSCGWVKKCKPCDKPLVLHKITQRLHCHICSATAQYPTECPVCFSKELMTGGLGTEQVEETLVNLFPHFNIARIDSDSMSRKGSLEKVMKEADNSELDILIGTKIITKGHDFQHITLVIILQADHALYSEDFRAKEHLAQLVHQVAGRSGRTGKQGEVFIQTNMIDDIFLQSLTTDSYAKIASNLLLERTQKPPYKPLALIHTTDFKHQKCSTSLESIRESIKRTTQANVTFGPITSAMIAKKSGLFDMQLPIYGFNKRELHEALAQSAGIIQAVNKITPVHIDIDPQSVA